MGQIAWLAAFVRPDLGAITNIGPAHLEFVGTIENVARAKAELLAALPAGAVAVVPAGEPLLDPFLRDDLDVHAVDEAAPLPFTTNFASEHQLKNARTAAAIADALGVPLPQHLDVEFTRHREEERPLPGGGLLLNDCYNANPLSMRAALENLVRRGEGHRRIAVLGDMRELGDAGPGYHAEIGQLVRDLGIEQLISVGELARAYGGDWVPDADSAAGRLKELFRPGDVVLVKGSLAVGLAAVAENLGV
jgi:UDP-N-acetylmuramoyl-tripeptide--D-alanyl-D-alanine ligase